MTTNLIPVPKFRAFNADGNPLASGSLYSYSAGTSNALATYTDQGGGTPNANPVVLDANGEANVWLGSSAYKFVLKDSTGVTQWTVDNVQSEVGQIASTASGQGASLVGVFDSLGAYAGTTVEASLAEIPKSSDTWHYAADTGSGTAYAVTLSPVPPALYAGMVVDFKANTTNTGNATLAVNSLPAKNLADAFGVLLPAGSIVKGSVYRAVYNGTQFTLLGMDATVTQGRSIIRYASATSVLAYIPTAIAMAGFRFQGSYLKGRAPLYPSPSSPVTVGTTSGLAAETAPQAHNWYGVFACANEGDAALVLKLMPFLRVGSVAGSVITLNYAGEGANAHSIVAATYTFTTNNLANLDCLVITETVNSKANAFSGRVTTISANSTTTVTLATISTVGAYDWILPAPKGYTLYAYLGSFYSDAGGTDVRNLADDGAIVKGYGVSTSDPNFDDTGAAANAQIRWGGYISPLATSVVIASLMTDSTSATLPMVHNFSSDSSSHVIHQHYCQKTSTSVTVTFVEAGIILPFAFDQSSYFYTTGSGEGNRSAASLQIRGYVER